MTFGYVPHPFGETWHDARQLLDKAVTKGGNRWDGVLSALNDGRAQLWLTVTDRPINATVTRMDGSTVEIWLCGGSVLNGSLHFLETILAAAKSNGATDARIVGRKGWARALKSYGWRADGDELVKDLAA
jgi:hypothetical protein